MQFQGGRCGWVSGQEVDFYIESDFFSLANVLLRQCSPTPTLSWPTLSCRYNIPTCGQGVEPNQCKCRFYACVKYFAQIPIFHNRDGSTFTPTSVTSPPCGGRPLNIDSCSCPNGNTITANNFIAAAVPLIQDILSGWVFESMSYALFFTMHWFDPWNVNVTKNDFGSTQVATILVYSSIHFVFWVLLSARLKKGRKDDIDKNVWQHHHDGSYCCVKQE